MVLSCRRGLNHTSCASAGQQHTGGGEGAESRRGGEVQSSVLEALNFLATE